MMAIKNFVRNMLIFLIFSKRLFTISWTYAGLKILSSALFIPRFIFILFSTWPMASWIWLAIFGASFMRPFPSVRRWGMSVYTKDITITMNVIYTRVMTTERDEHVWKIFFSHIFQTRSLNCIMRILIYFEISRKRYEKRKAIRKIARNDSRKYIPRHKRAIAKSFWKKYLLNMSLKRKGYCIEGVYKE